MNEALIAAIEGEQAALYAYGVAGAHLDAADRDSALGGLAAHQARILLLREQAPDSAEPGAPGGYLTGPVRDAAQARALLAGVEARLASAYAALAGATTGTDRTEAVLAGCECTVRAIGWGGPPEAFPGRG